MSTRKILIIGDDVDKDLLHAAIQKIRDDAMVIVGKQVSDTTRQTMKDLIASILAEELEPIRPDTGFALGEFKVEEYQPKPEKGSEFIRNKMRWKRERWQR